VSSGTLSLYSLTHENRYNLDTFKPNVDKNWRNWDEIELIWTKFGGNVNECGWISIKFWWNWVQFGCWIGQICVKLDVVWSNFDRFSAAGQQLAWRTHEVVAVVVLCPVVRVAHEKCWHPPGKEEVAVRRRRVYAATTYGAVECPRTFLTPPGWAICTLCWVQIRPFPLAYVVYHIQQKLAFYIDAAWS